MTAIKYRHRGAIVVQGHVTEELSSARGARIFFLLDQIHDRMVALYGLENVDWFYAVSRNLNYQE